MSKLPFVLHNQPQPVTQPLTSLRLAQPHLDSHCHIFITIFQDAQNYVNTLNTW
jgi:hypothetical protein